MPGALVLRAQVSLVVGVARRDERQAARDLDAMVAQSMIFCGLFVSKRIRLYPSSVSKAAATS